MTNKERYQRTFSALHASGKTAEVRIMKKNRGFSMRKAAPVLAVLVLVLGLSTAAYAADLGGIQRTVQIWIHGDQTEAVMEVGNGHYTLTYEGEDGKTHVRSGGGIAIGADGTERPLTEEELLGEINAPDVEYREDGSVWLCYLGQSMEITDRFEDGICYAKLVDGDEILYVTVEYGNGFSYGPHSFPQP